MRLFGVLFFVPLVASCAALRAADPPNDPHDVPSSYGPCGSWLDCGADQPKAERCCYPTTKCWVESDGTRSCVGNIDYDPADPATWSRKAQKHYRRSAAR